MLQNTKEIPQTTIEVTGMPNLGFPQTIIEECNTITLLKAFGKACKNFYLFNGQLSVSYLTILNIIQLHMLRKIEGAFFEPLQYILSSILNEPANTLMPDYNSALH